MSLECVLAEYAEVLCVKPLWILRRTKISSTGFVNGSTLSDADWFNDADEIVYGFLTTVAGTNTVTATGPVAMTAYATGQLFRFVPANTNTGATTINITPSGASALGAKNIFWNGAACVGNEIRANVPCIIYYDGTQFNVVGEMPYLVSSYTGTLTGCTTAPTYTIRYTLIGNQVTLNIPDWTATSNDTSKTITGMPAALYPARDQYGLMATSDNGAAYVAAQFRVTTAGVLTFTATAGGNTWTGSGTAASAAGAFTYTRA